MLDKLKKRYGPLPGWGWAAIVLVLAIAAILYWRSRPRVSDPERGEPSEPDVGYEPVAGRYSSDGPEGPALEPSRPVTSAPTIILRQGASTITAEDRLREALHDTRTALAAATSPEARRRLRARRRRLRARLDRLEGTGPAATGGASAVSSVYSRPVHPAGPERSNLHVVGRPVRIQLPYIDARPRSASTI